MKIRKLTLFLFTLVLLPVWILSCETQPTGPDGSGEDVEDNGSGGGDPSGDDNGHPGDGFFSHTITPGSSGDAFLRDAEFTQLLVEIQYMPGYRPDDTSLTELRTFLESHLDKADITFAEPVEIPAGDGQSYTAAQIRELEREHRNHYTEEGTLASYILFVDGEYENRNVLGIAYYNTSTAYFGKRIHEVSGSPPFSPSRRVIEGTVLRHEFGHLMGLVDIGTDMQQEHSSNGAHCSEQSCIMYASVNTADFFANLFDGSIPDFDDYCLADIGAAKSE